MKKAYLRYGLLFILIACLFAFPLGCGSKSDRDTGEAASQEVPQEVVTDEETEAALEGVRIGAFIGGTFVEGALALSVAAGDQLSPGGTATVRADLADADGDLFTAQSIQVTFTSPCTEAGRAVLDSVVTTTNGSATATYRADGCEGVDTITATVVIGGVTLVATGDIDVAATPVGSIAFVSATPEIIALQGTGGAGRQETSVVIFRVEDEIGNPDPGTLVNFALTTEVGGLSLSTDSGVTDANGNVQVIVSSGTIHTSVRVIATVDGTSISTVSDALVVSVGLPDQDSFSISVSDFNPEAWNFDGANIEVTVHAADHFNNPVPDGTAIAFTTEGGSIEGSCTTANGKCSVLWTSQDPRPVDGQVTILATAIGEESFIDEDGNGLFTVGDTPGVDLPEAFRDDNWNGTREAGEEFLDFNEDTAYTPANGLYNGVLCSTGACTDELLHVRDDIRICMSGSYAVISFFDTSDNPLAIIDLRGDLNGDGDICNDVGLFYVIVADENGNSMPKDTTITVTSTLGQLQGDTDFSVTNTCNPARLDLSMTEVCGGVPSSYIQVEVETPSGIITKQQILVMDDG